MGKKKEEEKIDILKDNWMDEFEEDFYFIRGAVDLARGCSSQEGVGISDNSIANVLEEAMNKLDDLQGLMDRVHHSIEDLKKLTPEQEKKRKMLEDQKQREYIQAVGKIGVKYENKIKAL